MGPKSDDRQHEVAVAAELAQRSADGVEVRLLWIGDDALRIVVDDVRTGESFELGAGDGREALDVFYHPFAYAAARGIASKVLEVVGAGAVSADCRSAHGSE